MFLSTILIQPMLLLILGWGGGSKLLLLGIQSGLYILVVSIVLFAAVYFNFSVDAVVLLLAFFIALSLVCFYLFAAGFRKLID